jgi:coronatine-insensitive protein 1
LSLENSTVDENDRNQWLHDLALHNRVLETLDFYQTNLYENKDDNEELEINIHDLEVLARNCPNLVSVKITDCKFLRLENFFGYASSLEEFGGTPIDDPQSYLHVSLPANLSRLSLTGIFNEAFLFPNAANLTKLDLRFAKLDTAGYCTLIQRCPNLEILEVRFYNFINDMDNLVCTYIDMDNLVFTYIDLNLWLEKKT